MKRPKTLIKNASNAERSLTVRNIRAEKWKTFTVRFKNLTKDHEVKSINIPYNSINLNLKKSRPDILSLFLKF